jgi:hypothetical protein
VTGLGHHVEITAAISDLMQDEGAATDHDELDTQRNQRRSRKGCSRTQSGSSQDRSQGHPNVYVTIDRGRRWETQVPVSVRAGSVVGDSWVADDV